MGRPGRTWIKKIGVHRLSFVLTFRARISYASRFGGSQNVMAVMWGDKQRVGAEGEYIGEVSQSQQVLEHVDLQ